MQSRIRRWLSYTGISLIAVAIAIQFVPYGRDRVNPPTVREPIWDSPQTRVLAKQACFDCHSNETEWPVYARVAPVSWLISWDVNNGRAALNFSEWHRPQKDADEAAEVIREHEMPPATYRWMHAHARLTVQERERLARGLATTVGVAKPERERLPSVIARTLTQDTTSSRHRTSRARQR